ncbi:DUF1960-domain-containing protein [Pterulicium gracile]|uniref:DUF1960-domain-containing protein n=1 Tax=Pterulicium gracile TaxID=1884261 RepID=A0A5C3QDG5_9AGAR|nr:DUF1960-domain-containing protein [Pterula gracilis]
MVKSLSKVVFKPDTQSTNEYIVIVNSEEFKKWKEGVPLFPDTSIPLAEVVDSFGVFHSGQGSQGLLGQVSNQELDSVFGTHKDIDVVEKILAEGRFQSGEGIKGAGWGATNDSKGSGFVDTRGGGSTRGI